MDYQILFETSIGHIQFYGLIFLLGSLTVASLSDLRRMVAQKDFAEVWGLFTVLALLYDIVLAAQGQAVEIVLMAKWILIFGYTLLSLKQANPLLRLALMDVAAIAAVLSLLPPSLILAFLIALIIVNELLKPLVRTYGDKNAYPFLPVILVTTALITGVALI